MNDLLLAYYGDDFTGSTDALECLAQAGVRTALFTVPPNADMLARFPNLQAFGVAGRTRALPTDEINRQLQPALEQLARLRPRHLHYKVCSTFDSSPTCGSIGRAIDVARRGVAGRYVPIVAAAPALGRFTLFGHHFATRGIGDDEVVYRLDRHPSAARHPATPMGESDLRRHLAQQSEVRIGLFDVRNFELSHEKQVAALERLLGVGAEAVLFDALDQRQLEQIGRLLDASVDQSASSDLRRPLFSVGSSGIEVGLAAHWVRQGQVRGQPLCTEPSAVAQVLVASGSCSPITESQIAWAAGAGFEEVPLPTPEYAACDDPSGWLARPLRQIVALLEAGKSVIVHTSKGRDDRRIAETRAAWSRRLGSSSEAEFAPARLLGQMLGRLLRLVLERIPVPRLCIAGGDTASFAVAELGVDALEMVGRLTRGAPLCRIAAADQRLNGVEIALKGGQVGKEDFFGSLRRGAA